MNEAAIPGSQAWPPGDGGMAWRIRDQDWSTTTLGAVEQWPQSLRTAVDLMLSSQPADIGWRSHLISLHDDGDVPVAGEKHPEALGQPDRPIWAKIRDEVRPVAEDVTAGHSRDFVDRRVPLARRPDPTDRPVHLLLDRLTDDSDRLVPVGICDLNDRHLDHEPRRLDGHR